MYLYWFERICRRMACDDCFALPYWDYNAAALPVLKFPPIRFERELILRIQGTPITLGPETVSLPVDLKEFKQRLGTLAESRTETVFLELDGVEAERQPGVAWQVFFGPPSEKAPDEQSPYFVGALSLFGQGIHSESHDKFEPAHFSFAISRALQASLKAYVQHWGITFVPRGILINGKPSVPKVQSEVKIARASLSVETQKHGGEPK